MSYTEMYRIGLAPGEAITSYAMDGAGSRRVMVVCSMHSYRISSLDIVAPLLSVMHRLEEVVDDSLVNARGVISTTIRSDMHVVVVDLDPEATSEAKEPLDPTGDASGDALVVGNAYLTSLCSNMNYFVSYDRSIKMKIPPSPLKVSSLENANNNQSIYMYPCIKTSTLNNEDRETFPSHLGILCPVPTSHGGSSGVNRQAVPGVRIRIMSKTTIKAISSLLLAMYENECSPDGDASYKVCLDHVWHPCSRKRTEKMYLAHQRLAMDKDNCTVHYTPSNRTATLSYCTGMTMGVFILPDGSKAYLDGVHVCSIKQFFSTDPNFVAPVPTATPLDMTALPIVGMRSTYYRH